jgi:hypothetical protein
VGSNPTLSAIVRHIINCANLPIGRVLCWKGAFFASFDLPVRRTFANHLYNCQNE